MGLIESSPFLFCLLLHDAIYKDDWRALLTGPDGASHLLSLAEGDPVGALVIRLQEEGIDSLVFFVGGVGCRAIGGLQGRRQGIIPSSSCFISGLVTTSKTSFISPASRISYPGSAALPGCDRPTWWLSPPVRREKA